MAERWDTEFKSAVLAWIALHDDRGPADALREFGPVALARFGRPLTKATLRNWLKADRPGGPPTSRTAAGQRERLARKKREALRLVDGGKKQDSTQDSEAPAAPSAALAVDGLDPRLFSADPIERQEGHIRTIGLALMDARKSHQGGVVAKLLDQLHAASKELDDLQAAARDTNGDVESMPEEEYLAAIGEIAADSPDPYLEVYVREYIRRHGLRLVR